mgnify:CR=1 FL=1
MHQTYSLTIGGGFGADSILSTEMASNVILSGDNGNDTLRNYSANATLNGGIGDDWIYNYADSATILYYNHYGEEYIYNYAENVDIILPDITIADIEYAKVFTDYYEVHFNRTSTIFVQKTDTNPTFRFSDGASYAYDNEQATFVKK